VKKLIATGFDAFGKHSSNPTEVAITNATPKYNSNFVKTMVLPTSYEKSWELLKNEILEFKPEIVLMFGLAHKAEDYSFEKIAINYKSATISDNDNELATSEPVLEGGDDGIFASIPIDDFIKSCGGRISLSAGSYVCNNLMYQCLNFTKDSRTQVGFIHVPGETKDQAQVNEFVENVINFAIK
jgi:pyroglutamyl-peptidase